MVLGFIEFTGWLTVLICGGTLVVRVTLFLYTTWIGPLLLRNIELSHYGAWAGMSRILLHLARLQLSNRVSVVTGATDGIGKSFAKQVFKHSVTWLFVKS